MISPCDQISEQMGGLFTCEKTARGYVRIRTPYLLPDGDIIDLFLRDDGKYHTLTDLGETLRWLRCNALTARKTIKQRQLIADVCRTCGIELFKGQLTLRTEAESGFAEKVTRLAQACLKVADIWFTFRTRSGQSVSDEVSDLLETKNIQFERNERQVGRSGRMYTIDFHTYAANSSSLVLVLATGTRGATRRISEHVMATWHDLSNLRSQSQVRFVSLFDDTVDVWQSEDFRIVEDFSDVRRWSRPEEFMETITV
ncbi:MAG: DUF1828 domain-containing protein [Planctomycetes bacterium]|nr:DUF1828 domain-containing protein [Planctomycetota bacterium]